MEFEAHEHYIRLATACPEVEVADVTSNVDQIKALYEQAAEANTALVVFPELSITGYTIGDIVQNQKLLNDAETGLANLATATANSSTVAVVGLPLRVGNGLYNCAAVLAQGEVKGIVPKQNMPNYSEFYEQRWYQKWEQTDTTIVVDDNEVPFGNDLLFDIGGVTTGIEICEDLWVRDAPSRLQAERGAQVIANPSASNELVGKANYRRQLVSQQSARLMAAYAYASCDPTESTTDIVMSGHQMIAENGRIIAERKPLSLDTDRLHIADVDLDHIQHDRLRDNNYVTRLGAQVVKCIVDRPAFVPQPNVIRDPFFPANESAEAQTERFDTIINIQAMGLAQRLRKTSGKVVLGLSGGLDSTLALLVAAESARMLGKKPGDVITTLTMPGMASSDRTQSNAQKLAEALNIPNEYIPIGDITREEFQALKHDGLTQDITYENVQARARTELLFNYANKNGGLVLGTGDLSEIALGWCTYNGDQMNHYNPNATIPKTLVRHLVRFVSQKSEFKDARPVLEDILDTPVSPELTTTGSGEITQTTEDIIGPYELHDFFLTYLIRWGDEPEKIRFLANIAFTPDYESKEIDRWLELFLSRFTKNQFKRSPMPDGAKVGTVALNPKGDWRMPSDMSPQLWTN